jgi:ComF family protein
MGAVKPGALGNIGMLAADFMDALTDRRCPGCGGPVDRAERVCVTCDAAVDRTGSVLCLACLRGGAPEGDAPPQRAGACPRHGSDCLLLAGPPHAAPLDAIVREFKYAGASALAPWVAGLIPEPPGISAAFGREAIVVPVPLHPARRAARGFDQAALLAFHVGGWWGVPVVHALRRVRETNPQARLGPGDRRENLHGAFALEERERRVVTGRTVLLLDDVATTGSTLLEAHRALRGAEPAWIIALAAAHGGGFDGPQFAPHE